MSACIDRWRSACTPSSLLPCTPPCRRHITGLHTILVCKAQGGFGPRRGIGGSLGGLSTSPASGRFCSGWEFWGYGNGNKRFNVTAVAPSKSEAEGVTESGNFSQSDEDLAFRGLTVHSTIDDLDLDQLNGLFAKFVHLKNAASETFHPGRFVKLVYERHRKLTGLCQVSFPRREKAKLLKALEHTQSLLWIQEPKSKQVIAFARATGDRVYHAIIWDVVVDPSYQGMGLGKVLMERLMADLVKMGISNIALYAEPNVVGFYQPLGFISDPDGIRAMAYSRRPR